MRLPVIDAPDHAVLIEVDRIIGGKMERDVGGESPIEQARGQAVMLGEAQPVPERIFAGRIAMSIFTEIAQQVSLSAGIGIDAGEGGAKISRDDPSPAIGEIGAKAAQRLLPGAFVEALIQLVPAPD